MGLKKILCDESDIRELKTRYGTIQRVNNFKYLGELINPTGLEKQAQSTRTQKVNTNFGDYTKKSKTRNCCNIKISLYKNHNRTNGSVLA